MLSGALFQLLRDPVVPYPRGSVLLATPSEPQRNFTSKKSLLRFIQVGFDVWLFLVCPAGVFREAQCRGARASPSPYVISYPHDLPPDIGYLKKNFISLKKENSSDTRSRARIKTTWINK